MAAALMDANRKQPRSALLFLGFAASLVGGQFNITIIEPASFYSGSEACDYNYDAVLGERLMFKVVVTTDMQGEEYTLLVRRADNFVPLDGCMQSQCVGNRSGCANDCLASSQVSNTDSGMYTVEASPYNTGSYADKKINICITVQDQANVTYNDNTSSSSIAVNGCDVQLTYAASGYPMPLSYELSCKGRSTISSDRGQFVLTKLPVGLINCSAKVSTARNLAWTASPPVSISVTGCSPQSSSSSSTPAPTISRTVESSTAPFLPSTASLPVAPNVGASNGSPVDQTATIAISVVVMGVLVVIGAVILVCAVRRPKRQLDQPATPASLLAHGSQCTGPTTIINNGSTYSYNFNGPVIEVNGPGSAITVIDSGSNGRGAVHIRGDDASRHPRATVHRHRHGQQQDEDEQIVYEYSHVDPVMPVAVEPDGEETAVKYHQAYQIAQG